MRIQMLTEPMTAGERAAAKAERDAWNAMEDRIARMEAALVATRALVSEGAMTGFNCHDGDWAKRLFANQWNITQALTRDPSKMKT